MLSKVQSDVIQAGIGLAVVDHKLMVGLVAIFKCLLILFFKI